MKYCIPLMLIVDLGDEAVLADLTLLPRIGRNLAAAINSKAQEALADLHNADVEGADAEHDCIQEFSVECELVPATVAERDHAIGGEREG